MPLSSKPVSVHTEPTCVAAVRLEIERVIKDFLNYMRYINSRFTYLISYLLTYL